METLSGYSISQFSAFPGSGRISADDAFFTSQVICPPAVYKEYESRSLTYGRLLEQLFADLSAAFGFQSMAYELSDAYARVGHVHKYNSFDVSAKYSADNDPDTVMLATFRVGDKKVRMRMPRQWVWKAPDPEIGELKFKALPTIAQPGSIDIHAAGFDGWVYPRGQSYAVGANEFTQAKTCFGQSATERTLNVPNIDRFIKAVPSCDITMSPVAHANTGVPGHSHSSSVALGGGSADVSVSAVVTKSAGYVEEQGGKLHNGDKGFRKKKYYKSTLYLVGSDITVRECEIGYSESALAREQYPSYNYLPVMIYIGKKR